MISDPRYTCKGAGFVRVNGTDREDCTGCTDCVIKTCSCGLAYTEKSWQALHFVGYYDDDVLDPSHPTATTLELRNCKCGSTLSVEHPRRKAYATPKLAVLSAADPRVQAILRGETERA